MDYNFEAKKQGYLANSYIKVLDAQLTHHYTNNI